MRTLLTETEIQEALAGLPGWQVEGKELVKHVGPKIFVVDPSNVESVPQTNILPPDGYKPVFSVN